MSVLFVYDLQENLNCSLFLIHMNMYICTCINNTKSFILTDNTQNRKKTEKRSKKYEKEAEKIAQ